MKPFSEEDKPEPELTTESISRMIDVAVWKSETRILRKVIKAILANNQRILEQLTEAGMINQE